MPFDIEKEVTEVCPCGKGLEIVEYGWYEKMTMWNFDPLEYQRRVKENLCEVCKIIKRFKEKHQNHRKILEKRRESRARRKHLKLEPKIHKNYYRLWNSYSTLFTEIFARKQWKTVTTILTKHKLLAIQPTKKWTKPFFIQQLFYAYASNPGSYEYHLEKFASEYKKP